MNETYMAVERGKRFHAELKSADPATAAQLLSAWKELIMDEMVKLLQATKDPKILQHTDENIALAQGATRLKFGVITGGKKDEPKTGPLKGEFEL